MPSIGAVNVYVEVLNDKVVSKIDVSNGTTYVVESPVTLVLSALSLTLNAGIGPCTFIALFVAIKTP